MTHEIDDSAEVNCEACERGYRLAGDGLHYDDEHGGATWGVCRRVVAKLEQQDRANRGEREVKGNQP